MKGGFWIKGGFLMKRGFLMGFFWLKRKCWREIAEGGK
jgi:hypothetical protein